MEPLTLLTLLGGVYTLYFAHAIIFILLDYFKIAEIDIKLDDDDE